MHTLIFYKTPLHWANLRNAIEVARLLIEKGADIDTKNKIDQITFQQIFMMFVLILFFF